MEILQDIQKEVLRQLKGLPDIDAFYLTDGTALSAFYLHHRKSNDLDFFTSVEELIGPFSLKAEEALKENGFAIERKRGFRSFVELFVQSPHESTIIHLAPDSPFRFEPPVIAEGIYT